MMDLDERTILERPDLWNALLNRIRDRIEAMIASQGPPYFAYGFQQARVWLNNERLMDNNRPDDLLKIERARRGARWLMDTYFPDPNPAPPPWQQ
jgi:hypothetical protein